MWFALLCFSVGFAAALLSVAAALYLLFTAGRAKVRAGLEGERSRRAALLAHDAPKQPSSSSSAATAATKPEWTSSSDVELLRPGAAPTRVALRAALPILFVLRPDGEERLGTVLLERCVVRVEKATRKGRVCPRWHESNALLLRARDGGEVFDGAAEVRLRFATGRELERWFCVCEQGCAAGEAAGAAARQHPQRHSRGEKGAAWREAFGALCHGLTEGGGGGGGGASPPAAAVCANIALGKLLNFWRTREAFTGYIQKKINKQLAKVDPPKALKGQIRVVDVEIGNALPVLSDAALYGGGFAPTGAAGATPARVPQTGGDFAVEADLLYTGGEFAVTLEIDFDVKLFDVSIPLPKVVARVQVTGVQGRLRAEFSSFSDYLWIAFVEEPRFDVRLVTDTPDLPLKILSRADIPELTELVVTALKTELIELMVYPRMEDLFLPLIHEEETEDAATAVVAGEEEPAGTPASPASAQEQPAAAPAVDTAATAQAAAPSSAAAAEEEALPRAASSSASTATSEGRHVRELGKKKVNAKDLFAGAMHGGVHAKAAKAAPAAPAPPAPVVAAEAAAVAAEPAVEDAVAVPPAVAPADAVADEPETPTAVETIQETLRGIHPMVDTALEVLPAVVKSLEESDAAGAVAAAAAAATAVSDAAAAEEEESVTPSESAEDAAVAEVEEEAAAPAAAAAERAEEVVVESGKAGDEEASTKKAEEKAVSPPSPSLPAAAAAPVAAAQPQPHRQPQWTQQPQWGDASLPAEPVPVPVPEPAPAAVTTEATADEGKSEEEEEEEVVAAPDAATSSPSGPTYSNAAGLAAAFSSSSAAEAAEEVKKTVKVNASSLFKKAKTRARRVE